MPVFITLLCLSSLEGAIKAKDIYIWNADIHILIKKCEFGNLNIIKTKYLTDITNSSAVKNGHLECLACHSKYW